MNKRKSLTIVIVFYLLTSVIGGISYIYFRNLGYGILLSTLIMDIIMTVIVFSVSLKVNNSSFYDPYWSVIPVFIVGAWVIDLSEVHLYSILIMIGVFTWAYRLTRNWAMDFTGFTHEDFRYVDFRNRFGKGYWLISFLAIHLFPTLIVLASLAPLLYVLENGVQQEIFIYLGVIIMVSGALISFISDAQLREHKHSGKKNSIYSGMWSYSRHPNYLGEVFFWFGAFITSLATGFLLVNALGFIGMLLLFNFYSVPKMEAKLLDNKEDYHFVIASVSRFFPFPKSSPISEVATKDSAD